MRTRSSHVRARWSAETAECSCQGPSPEGAIHPASTRGGCLAKEMGQHLGVQRSSRFRLFRDPPSTSHWGHVDVPIFDFQLCFQACASKKKNPHRIVPITTQAMCSLTVALCFADRSGAPCRLHACCFCRQDHGFLCDIVL